MDGTVFSEAFVPGKKSDGCSWRSVIKAKINQLRKYLHPSWHWITLLSPRIDPRRSSEIFSNGDLVAEGLVGVMYDLSSSC